MLRAATLLLAASVAAAQQPAPSIAGYRARLLGVFDLNTGGPVEGVEVTDLTSGTKALTTATGTMSLAYLPDGGSMVRIRKLGYMVITRFIAISPNDTVPLTLMLTPTTTILPAVVTNDSSPHYHSPGLQQFEERRKAGFGRFITEGELRKSDNREMPDVLRQLSGVQITCTSRTPRSCIATTFRQTRGGGAGCRYTVFVDGMRLSDANLLMLNVNSFAGVEAYSASTIPPQYNRMGSGCGVLLFWSRER